MLYRVINRALLDADLETCERLWYWVHNRERLEYLIELLYDPDPEARLWALEEVDRWGI